MSDFQYIAQHVRQLSWKSCHHYQLMFTLDDNLWMPKAHKERVTFIVQISTVYSSIGCLSRINFLLNVSHVIYTQAGAWNNPYIFVTTCFWVFKILSFSFNSDYNTDNWPWPTKIFWVLIWRCFGAHLGMPNILY